MPGNESSYDAVIVGGGPAGIIGAVTATHLGHTVAIVDRQAELGGAGVNTGTVPSKTLRETALALSGMRSRKLYGVDLSLRRDAAVSDFLRHERNVKAGLNTLLSERLRSSGAVVYHGTGYFEDPHTIQVRLVSGDDEVSLRAQHVLIATGSTPVRPAVFPFGNPGVYDSDSILQLDKLPRTLAVVGGGVVGSEYASTFAALGTRVFLIDGHGILLPFLDAELSRALTVAMESNGITFHWNQRVEGCTTDAGNKLTLTLSSKESLVVDAVLVAAGRRTNVEDLNLAVAGVTANDRGLVRVDEFFRTDVPHIYAAGDAVGFPALASTSMQQGRLAMKHAFGADVSSAALRLLPTGIYTIPEVGMVGETEESLTKNGIDYVVGLGPYYATSRGRIVGDESGFLKLLFQRRDMRLLGAHALGERATELVHIGLVAMLTNSTAELFADTCFNLPTLGELYKLASLDAISRETTGRSLLDLPSLDPSAYNVEAARRRVTQ